MSWSIFVLFPNFLSPEFISQQVPLPSCTDCWCLPEDGPDGKCPDIDKRQLTYDQDIIDKFKSYQLTLTPYKDLPHLVPQGTSTLDESSHTLVYEPVCSPYPDLADILGLPPCEFPSNTNEDAVCAFYYNDENCDSGRHYGMKTFESEEEAKEEGATVTHLGACGVCSNALDLAINMIPETYEKAFQCSLLLLPPTEFKASQNQAEILFNCFLDIGFTQECSWLWVGNTLSSFLGGCVDDCLASIGKPLNDPETCDLNPCLACDEEVSGEVFHAFSGRTRRNSGIITLVVRDCESIANIEQDPCPTAQSRSKSSRGSKRGSKRSTSRGSKRSSSRGSKRSTNRRPKSPKTVVSNADPVYSAFQNQSMFSASNSSEMFLADNSTDMPFDGNSTDMFSDGNSTDMYSDSNNKEFYG